MKNLPITYSQLRVTHRDGFTIVEMLVAMGIFVSVLGIVVGIFIGSLRAERSLVGFMAINDNVSLALEQMAREMRTGEDFIILGAGALGFTNAKGEHAAYRAMNGLIERGICETGPCTDLTGFSDFVPLTGNKAIVDRLSFDLVHENFSPEKWPPRITIRLGISSATPDTYGGHTDIQTTISARGN
jgi:prepilin-type N-terminal cleavage/methylation domain-containing protein